MRELLDKNHKMHARTNTTNQKIKQMQRKFYDFLCVRFSWSHQICYACLPVCLYTYIYAWQHVNVLCHRYGYSHTFCLRLDFPYFCCCRCLLSLKISCISYDQLKILIYLNAIFEIFSQQSSKFSMPFRVNHGSHIQVNAYECLCVCVWKCLRNWSKQFFLYKYTVFVLIVPFTMTTDRHLSQMNRIGPTGKIECFQMLASK